MAEFIEREKALQFVFDACAECMDACEEFDGIYADCNQCMLEGVKLKLRDLPAADVRPVVTCGKCKYGKYTGTEWFCDKHSGHADKFGEDASYHEYHNKHWFCADGEART